MASEVVESFVNETNDDTLRTAYKILDLIVVEFDYLPMESVILTEEKLTSDKLDEVALYFISIFKTILAAVGIKVYDDITLDNLIILMHFITYIGNEEALALLEPLIDNEDPVLSVCQMVEVVTGEPIDPITFASEALEDVDEELYIKIKALIEAETEDTTVDANILIRIETYLKGHPDAIGKTLANNGVTGGISSNYLSIFKEKILGSDKSPDEVVSDMISLMIVADVPAMMIKDKLREIMNDYIANTSYVRNRQELFTAIASAEVN